MTEKDWAALGFALFALALILFGIIGLALVLLAR